jgi:gamma-glutamylcyclotransferase (GGCT)/AIG2-like uncharacterized protein YtfP
MYENDILYCAYGSNLNHEQMAYRCPNAVFVGTGIIKNYRLVFRGVADIEWARGQEVHVGLWSVTVNCIVALDRYEGYPHLYERGGIEVIMNGKKKPRVVETFFYYMNSGSYGEPTTSYLQSIAAGYADCGLPLSALTNAITHTERLYWQQHELTA